jgi:hypothetical protein
MRKSCIFSADIKGIKDLNRLQNFQNYFATEIWRSRTHASSASFAPALGSPACFGGEYNTGWCGAYDLVYVRRVGVRFYQ